MYTNRIQELAAKQGRFGPTMTIVGGRAVASPQRRFSSFHILYVDHAN
jgi:hypothetical protein